MVTKKKDDWINIRVGSKIKNEIQLYIDKGEYASMSAFVVKAITEKLNPSTRDAIVMRELEEMKLRNPEFFRNLLK